MELSAVLSLVPEGDMSHSTLTPARLRKAKPQKKL